MSQDNDLVSGSTPHYYTPLSVVIAHEFDTNYLVGKLKYYALSSIIMC